MRKRALNAAGPRLACFFRKYWIIALVVALFPTMLNVVYRGLYFEFKDWWPILNYFIGYETGFGGRKLIGTLSRLVFPETVTAYHLRWMLFPAIFLMLLLMAWMVWRSLSGLGKKALPMAGVLVFYALTPFSILEYASSPLSLAFMETYQLLLVMVWLLLFIRHRDSWLYFLLTPLITIACCLIHHTFCCTLFPLLFGLFVYDTLEEGKLSWRKAVFYAGNLLLLLVLFVMLWSFSTMNVDIDTLYNSIMARTNVCTDEKEVIDLLYYKSSTENFMISLKHLITQKIFEFMVSFLMMLPVMAIFCYPWLSSAWHSKDKLSRLRYLLPVLSVLLLTIPVFLIATDYSRWWVCWCFGLVSLLLAAAANRDVMICQALENMAVVAKKRWWLTLLLIVYVVQLHNVSFEGLQESVEMVVLFKRWVFAL